MEPESAVLKVVSKTGGREKTTDVPIERSSTFADVLCHLNDPGDGCIVEKWRHRHERTVAKSELPADLMRQWGASNPEVQFLYREKGQGSGRSAVTSPLRRSARLQTPSRTSPRRPISSTSRTPSNQADQRSSTAPISTASSYASSIAKRLRSSPQAEVRKLRDQLDQCNENRKRAEHEVDKLVSVCSSHEQQIDTIRQQMVEMRTRLAQCKEIAARGRYTAAISTGAISVVPSSSSRGALASKRGASLSSSTSLGSKPGVASSSTSSVSKPDVASSSSSTSSSVPKPSFDIAGLQQERDRLRRELKDCQEKREAQSEELQANTSILRTKREELGRVRKSVEKTTSDVQLLRQQEGKQQADDVSSEMDVTGPAEGSDRKRVRRSPPQATACDSVPIATSTTTTTTPMSSGTIPKQPEEEEEDLDAEGQSTTTLHTVSSAGSATETDGAGSSKPMVPDLGASELLPVVSETFGHGSNVKLADGVPVRHISHIDSVITGRRGSLRRSSSEYGSFSRSGRPGSFSARSSIRSMRTDSSSPLHSDSSFTRSNSDGLVPDRQQHATGPGGSVWPNVKTLASGVVRRKTASSAGSLLSLGSGDSSAIVSPTSSGSAMTVTSPTAVAESTSRSPVPMASPMSSQSPNDSSSLLSPGTPMDTSGSHEAVEPSIVPVARLDSGRDTVISPTQPLECIVESDDEGSSASRATTPHEEEAVPEPPAAVKPVKSILKRRLSDKEGNKSPEIPADLRRGVQLDPLCVLLDAAFFGELAAMRMAALEVRSISAGGKDAVTALHSAAVNGFKDCVDFLLQYGADPNAIDGDGWTPLHCSASEGNIEVLKVLLEGGCAVLTPTADGMTPLEVALDSKASSDTPEIYDDVIALLRDAEERLGVANDSCVYAAFPYGDGKDFFLMPVIPSDSEGNAAGNGAGSDDDDDENEEELEEFTKDLEADELRFGVGECLRILKRTDIKFGQGNDDSDDDD
eukprot:scpid36415/ scgid12029/ Apoptosis-stimulating of p53 protein 2; Bcl2-binding protein; Renal carcinoma antigen NY-REN-51; Tumor suppressor p53-binding protein 2